MITNADQAAKMYRLLRPNGTPSDDEINGTVNRRSYAQFVNDGQGEVAARDAALREQSAQLGNMQNLINTQNETITAFQLKLADVSASNDEKQHALDQMLAQTADINAQLASSHDVIVACQAQIEDAKMATPEVPAASNWLIKLLDGIFKRKN